MTTVAKFDGSNMIAVKLFTRLTYLKFDIVNTCPTKLHSGFVQVHSFMENPSRNGHYNKNLCISLIGAALSC